MSIQNFIHHGIFTLNDLSNVIDANLYLAHKLDIHIRYRVTNRGTLNCELHRYGIIIHNQEYTGKFLHIRLANMYASILEIMREIEANEKAERERIAREKAEEERLNKLPMWQDRYKSK